MKRLKVMMAAIGLVGALAAPVAADPVDGLWQTEADDGAYAYVQMGACGSKICGVIARTFNASGEYKSPNLGKTLVIDMVPDGPGSYAGKVWRPANNKIYIGKMTLSGNKLKLRGCVAGGLICKAQNWVRVP